ncbi:uncharacterized protein LOC120357332 [Solenopsis invicta]|uniref:uncharacterized protein LOC120357332 n=1 Tax=Solenopsis invicta TaxID=13686 RepID=UPI00193CB976|nr:uncharacterized protein LOC120357332 [Solenopsis invicta]
MTERTPQEERELQTFLATELAKFEHVRGPTDQAVHHIRVKTEHPIKQRYRSRNPAMQRIIDEEVHAMEAAGVIEPSNSAWSSPVVIVRKKDGRHRFCIDFRKVNEVTERDAYPLPHITPTLDKLRGAKYLSTLDLEKGYWQIPLTPESRPITAFTVPGRGLMQFTVMPFGLHSAPATFQRLLDRILGPELEPHVFVYLDDVIIASPTFADHLKHLEEVFRRLREARLKLNPEKCYFCRTELKYLGHIVDRRGIRTDPDKVRAVTEWPTPTNIRQIRQFVGLASWYRRFTPNFAAIAAPLTQLTRKNARWRWGPEEEHAFQSLKEALTTAPTPACPDFSRRFLLQTDASQHGLGAVLSQYFEDGERVIAYASRSLNGAEKNYSATELECLAVVWGIRHLRGYLEGYEFTVITDHQALQWLRRMDSPTGRLGRWALELQQYSFDVRSATCVGAQKTSLTMRFGGGRLYRRILHSTDFKDEPAEAQWKRCIPRPERPTILTQVHDAPTAGHLGIAKTIARAARRYYWPGMFADIARYVRNCRSCLRHKHAQTRPAGLLHTSHVDAPWTQVTMDLVGPLPRSTSGHTWLLVMQDRFTKWVELSPLRRATAATIAQHVADRIIYRHGCPRQVISDNGRPFIGRPMKALLQELGVEHRTTPAYAPHCNPVERTNRTIKTMVAQFVGNNHRLWDQQLGALQFAYNTAPHDATGYSPAYLNHGRELEEPTGLRDQRPVPAATPTANQQRLGEANQPGTCLQPARTALQSTANGTVGSTCKTSSRAHEKPLPNRPMQRMPKTNKTITPEQTTTEQTTTEQTATVWTTTGQMTPQEYRDTTVGWNLGSLTNDNSSSDTVD